MTLHPALGCFQRHLPFPTAPFLLLCLDGRGKKNPKKTNREKVYQDFEFRNRPPRKQRREKAIKTLNLGEKTEESKKGKSLSRL